MKLTQYTDYSLRALMYIAAHQDRLVTISEIARYHGVSRNHIVKVIHQLAVLGYIDTQRGKSGGVRLARDASDILIGQVVLDMESNMDIVECFSNKNACVLSPRCRLKAVIQQATLAFVETLNQTTLADLSPHTEPGSSPVS